MLYEENMNRIKELEEKLQDHIIYEGSYRKIVKSTENYDDNYFMKMSKKQIILDTLGSINKLNRLYLRNWR